MGDSSAKRSLSHAFATAGEGASSTRRRRPVNRLLEQAPTSSRSASRKRAAPASPPKAPRSRTARRTTRKKSGSGGRSLSSTFKSLEKGEVLGEEESEEDDDEEAKREKDSDDEEEEEEDQAKPKKKRSAGGKRKKVDSDDEHEQEEDEEDDEEEDMDEEDDEEEEDYAPKAKKRSSSRKKRPAAKRVKRVEPSEDEEDEDDEEDAKKRSKKVSNGDSDDEDGDYGTSRRSRKGANKRGAVVRRSSRKVSRNPKYDAVASDDEDEEDDEDEDGSDDASEEESPAVLHIDKMLGVRKGKAGKKGEKGEEEYLVKYRGRSYLHVEWVDKSTIESIPGGKARLKHFASKHEDAALLDDLARRRRILLNRQRHSATALPKPADANGAAAKKEEGEKKEKKGDDDKMDEEKEEKEEVEKEEKDEMEEEEKEKKTKNEKKNEGDEEEEEEEAEDKKQSKKEKEEDEENENEEEEDEVPPERKFLEELVEAGHFDRDVVRVDRVVAGREAKGGPEYLIKWRTLPYEDATWEAEAELRLLAPNWAKKLRQFKAREKLPSLASRKTFRRPKPSAFDDDAEYVPNYSDPNLTLRDYQVEGIKWLVYCWYKRRNSILADEMGLGKTLQSVSILQYLVQEEENRGPFLVVAPMSTIEQWRREVEGRTFMNCVVFHGTEEARNLIRKHEFHYTDSRGRRVGGSGLYKFHVLITTFEMVLKETFLGNIDWQYMVIDEGHRIKSKKTKLFQQLFQYNAQHKLILTGTPMQNHIEELWTMLHFLNPEEFDDVDQFKVEYGDLKTKEQVDKLQASLRPYMLRRMKEDVDKTIPLKEETIVEVELTSTQKKYYRAILDKNREFLYRGAKSNSNLPQLTNILMELRKCCNHPYLIAGAERRILDDAPPCKRASAEEKDVLAHQALVNSSSKLVLLDKLLTKLREDGHKVLIFSQMVMMLDILEDYLIMRGFPMERLDGGVGRRDRQAAIDRFTNPEVDSFAFLLSTRAGGLGLNLTAANTVIIYDSDWNPQNDLQAQARAHRIGQTQQVKIYRFVTRNTYESYMLDIVSKKLGLESAIMNDDDEMKKEDIDKLLKYGAYHLFQEDAEEQKQQEHVMLNEDIHSILGRAHTIQYDRDTEEKGAAAAFKGLSKVTYATSSSDMDINLDDDNFWEKILPEMKTSKSLAARVAAGQVETEAQREEFIRDITALVEEVKEGMMSRSASYAYQSAHSGRELHAFLVKLINHKSFTDKERERLIELQAEVGDGKRTRTQVQRMGQERGRRGHRAVKAVAEDEGEEASEYEAEESDGSSPSEGGKTGRQGQPGGKGPVRETLQVRRERLSGAWNAKQLKVLKSWLLASGYGRWQELLEDNYNLNITKHPEQVQALAECLIQLCFHNSDPAAKDAADKPRSRKRQYRQILEEKSFYAQVLSDSLSGTLTDLMTMHKKWAAAHAKKPVNVEGTMEVDVLVRDGVGRMNGFDGKYWPGHVLYVEVKVRDPEKDQVQLFLLVSLLSDAKQIDSGYLRTYPLTKKKADEEFYTAVVHAPGFEGKYSLDVVYFETRQYPNSTNAKGKFTERRCSMHVWHEMSPTEAAGAEGAAAEGGEAANKPKLALTTAAATPTAFRFSVVPHPLVTGEPIESLQRQRKQYNVRLFILRHLKALVEQHEKKWDTLEMPKLNLNLPADWWTAQDDRNLLLGVHRHGWGRVKDLRDNVELGFSAAALRARTQKKGKATTSNDKKRKGEEKKEKEKKDDDEEEEDDEQESKKGDDGDVDDPDFPTAATLNKRLTRLVEELATTAKPTPPSTPTKKVVKTTKAASSSSSSKKTTTKKKDKDAKDKKEKEKTKKKTKKDEAKPSKAKETTKATKPTKPKASTNGTKQSATSESNGKHDDGEGEDDFVTRPVKKAKRTTKPSSSSK